MVSHTGVRTPALTRPVSGQKPNPSASCPQAARDPLLQESRWIL